MSHTGASRGWRQQGRLYRLVPHCCSMRAGWRPLRRAAPPASEGAGRFLPLPPAPLPPAAQQEWKGSERAQTHSPAGVTVHHPHRPQALRPLSQGTRAATLLQPSPCPQGCTKDQPHQQAPSHPPSLPSLPPPAPAALWRPSFPGRTGTCAAPPDSEPWGAGGPARTPSAHVRRDEQAGWEGHGSAGKWLAGRCAARDVKRHIALTPSPCRRAAPAGARVGSMPHMECDAAQMHLGAPRRAPPAPGTTQL